jgi:GH24 family phage-related lysozyme (muramidase)
MNLPESALDFIKITRPCNLEPYLDSDGSPAQGWNQRYRTNGEACATKVVRVSISDPAITQADADQWLAAIVSRDFWPNVQNIPGFCLMADEQRTALLSFCMSTGYTFNAEGFEDMTAALQNRNYNDICAVLMGSKYRMEVGEYSVELTRLRYAENLLWRGATPVNAWEKARRAGLGELAGQTANV